jgi:4-hydroxybenzoyl-CoA thioesterase
MALRFPLAVRFGDLDSAGIVYFPRYLHFCHVGMEEYFTRIVGTSYPAFLAEHRLGLPTVRSECEHHRPIRYGDRIELETEVTRVGSTSVEWRHRFWATGAERPLTECRVVTVLVDMSSFEKRPVPDWLREKLA